VRLTDKEQRHVRTALRFLRHRVGGWQPLADALGTKADTIGKVLRGGRAVTASLAYRIDVAMKILANRGLQDQAGAG
jgi:plasmid maintenance system antidote protein VapI